MVNTEIPNFSATNQTNSPIPNKDTIQVNGRAISFDQLAYEMSTLRGFKYPISDLEAIINYVKKYNKEHPGQNQINSVYTMFSLNADPKSVARRKRLCKNASVPCILYSDMYFQVANPATDEIITYSSIGREAFDEYADFPEPCPDSCP